MWDQIIDIHPSELLHIKTKEFRINEHKKLKLKLNEQFTFST